jgi:hypothetical protein
MIRCASVTIVGTLIVGAVAASSASAFPRVEDGPGQGVRATLAAASPLPTLGPADGVSAARAATKITLRFTGAAGQAIAGYAGRRLQVECAPAATTGLLLGADDKSSWTIGNPIAPKPDGAGGFTLTLSLDDNTPPLDLCTVLRPALQRTVRRVGPFVEQAGDERPALARVPLTPVGTTWIADFAHVIALGRVERALPPVVGHRYPAIADVVARVPGVVALAGPDASPPAGTVGYWSDGGEHVVIATTADDGRRLFLQDLGGGLGQTNLRSFQEQLPGALNDVALIYDTNRLDRDAHAFTGPRPKAGGPDGVHAEIAGKRLTVRATGRAAVRALHAAAGRRVAVTCNPARLPGPLFSADDLAVLYTVATARVPRHGATLRVKLSGAVAHDLCVVSDDGATVLTFAATAAGRGLYQDLAASAPLFGDDSGDTVFAPQGATAYRSTQAIVAADPRHRVALPGPDAFPPVGRVGVWSSGPRLTLAVTSPTGHHIVFADEGGGVLRENVDALTVLTPSLFDD